MPVCVEVRTGSERMVAGRLAQDALGAQKIPHEYDSKWHRKTWLRKMVPG